MEINYYNKVHVVIWFGNFAVMANDCKAQETTSLASHNQYQEPGYFQFPFIPYEIQVEFMKELYSVLEKGGVGIFESPTGTVSCKL